MLKRAVLLAALLSAAPLAAADDPIVCFYGPPPLEKLARYRTVVLQPSRVTPADVQFLRERGVRVLGYISLGEDDSLRRGDGKGPGGYASWYVDEHAGAGLDTPGSDGKPDSNAGWGSYYVDPSDRDWKGAIKAEARRIREDLGMDGLFADTVLIPRDRFTRGRERRMTKGMVSLLRSLKSWSRDGFIVLNNGEDLAGDLGKKIDGLMIETQVEDTPDGWNDLRVLKSRIDPLRRPGFLVSGLVYLAPGASPREACAALDRISLPAALYRSDAAGRSLTSLPLSTCP